MLFLLLCGPVQSIELLSFAALDASQPIAQMSLEKTVLLNRLVAIETEAFLMPIWERLILAQQNPKQTSRLKSIMAERRDCKQPNQILLGIDYYSYVYELLQSKRVDRKYLKVLSLLGLDQLDSLSVCATIDVSKQLLLSFKFNFKKQTGLLALFSVQSSELLKKVPQSFFFALDTQVKSGHDLIQQLKQLEALYWPVKKSRIDAFFVALSLLTDNDAEDLLLSPLSGKITAGITLPLSVPMSLMPAARYLKFETSSTQKIIPLLNEINQYAPHIDPYRARPKNEWAFDVGIATLSATLPVYIRTEPQQLMLADGQAALQMKEVQLKQWFKHTLPHFISTKNFLVAAMDVQQLRTLFKRVGRKNDVLQWMYDFSLLDWADKQHLPKPDELLTGYDQVILSFKKQNDQELWLDAQIISLVN